MYSVERYSDSNSCCFVAKSCLSFCDPMDCSQPGSSVHGLSQARILELAAFSFSRGSSRPKNQTCVSCLGRWIITNEPPGKPRSSFNSTAIQLRHKPPRASVRFQRFKGTIPTSLLEMPATSGVPRPPAF